MRILITEDNGEIAEFVKTGLNNEGYLSDVARSLGEMKLLLSTTNYSAIILDLGLPDGDGMRSLAVLRREGLSVPVLILTARGGIQDRIKGLDVGADDYLTKPFAIDELLARLRALLRRSKDFTSQVIVSGNLTLDLINKSVGVDGTNIPMGKTEYAVLESLIRSEGLTVSKESIESNIYQYSDDITDNALQVAIHRVRKKLESNCADVKIVSIRGVGYLLRK